MDLLGDGIIVEQRFKKGQRVALHACTDEFMQGDRYGEIVRDQRPGVWRIAVKMDSGRIRRIHAANLLLIP